MVRLAEQAAQLGQAPLGVRVGVEEQIDGAPQQAHQQVAAAAGARGLADQLLGQLAPQRPVFRAQDAVVGEAQGLGQGDRVARAPRFRDHGENRGVPVGAVVLLTGQPDPQPQAQRRALVDQPQGTTLARAHHGLVGGGAMLVHPEPPEAQRRTCHQIVQPLRLTVGRVEPLAAGLKVPLDVQSVFPRPEGRLHVVPRGRGRLRVLCTGHRFPPRGSESPSLP